MMHGPDVVEVVSALESDGVDVWVHGGWGIDAGVDVVEGLDWQGNDPEATC